MSRGCPAKLWSHAPVRSSGKLRRLPIPPDRIPLKQQLEQLVLAALNNLPAGLLPEPPAPGMVVIERTKDTQHGDFTTNVALRLAKAAKRNPRELAQAIVAALAASSIVARTEVAGAGFINFFLNASANGALLKSIHELGERYGRGTTGAGVPVVVEFVSANPTGPLHVGHGRQAALGDALSSLLEAQGYAVTREYYYNDAGAQIQNLARSVQARARGIGPGAPDWPKDGYAGEYIQDVASDFLKAQGDVNDLGAVRDFAVAYLRREQDEDLKEFGLRFDVYSLESKLYADGSLDNTVLGLVESGKTFENESALWLRTTDYGDDKDRVVRKSDGSYTYFVPDVAYHVTKWKRGFKLAINIQGADHHGTMARVRAGLQALDMGIPGGYPEYVLHQMVKVTRDGEEVKISKRAGSYVTLRDLIDWVGRDAVRFFLVSRKPDSEFVFDVNLARSRSDENPVYYVQYAHARVASVMKQLAARGLSFDRDEGLANAQLLSTEQEQAVLNLLGRYPELLEQAATNRAPHSLVHYLRDLANALHTYYNAEQFIVSDAKLRNARLALVLGVQQVLRNGLTLLGVSAPESM
jgi:arginyl-tRNA synthetase